MSRIEKAMERAAQIRQGAIRQSAIPQDAAPQKKEPAPRPVQPRPPQQVAVAEKISLDSPFLVNLDAPYSPIGEEFRKLKSTLVKLTTGDEFNNTILVTSSVPHEGKSVTALNLAISLAQEYDHTVLLIDADFRRPSIHNYLGIELNKGFADCLLGEAQLSDVLIPTGIGRLSVVTAGREVSNPVELFASQKTDAMIAEMKNRYHDRFIIFDSPPVLPFAEAGALAHLVDGVLFVVKEQLASQKNVKEAIDSLKGCNLLGMVYNDTVIDRHDEKYTSYGHYNRTKP
jgi:receptor protein-tyrosine kinase/non-specific protein-tyrosine kinase